jgi:nicotinamidase-related amidase
MPLSFERSRTAVLAMDCQAGLVAIYTKDDGTFISRAARLLKQARSAGVLVIHIRVGFRPKLPELSERNLLTAAIKSSPERQQLFMGRAGEVHPALAPNEDILITKHRVSAFAGTELDMILRTNQIDTLVLFGISTSGVVLSTLVEAFDRDYRVVVVRDLCADPNAELHACLLEKYFPLRGTVTTSEEAGVALES